MTRIRGTRLIVLALMPLALLACGEGRRSITGAAEQYGLSVRVRPSSGLAAVGQALGWPSGAVPGATVIAERAPADPTDAPSADTVVSDGNGFARFASLSLAHYTLHVTRAFSVNERARAASALGDADGLVGVATVSITASAGDTVGVELTAVGGSSLVFSEIFPTWPEEPSRQQYYYGGFFEIYNNSDSTVQMAGKLFFDAWQGYLQSPVRPNGCSIFTAIERDPAGLWGYYVYRFPETAKPLPPGGVAVLATDAIDHRQFGGAGFFDLSRADFEFLGTKDVDNPLALNMISVGPRTFVADGHGFRFHGGRSVWGLANPVNMDSLPLFIEQVFGFTYTRIPTAALLDVVRWNWDEPHDPSITDCPSSILSNIDAADAVLLHVEDTLTIQRKVSRTLPSGRVVLQRSRNSAADFSAGRGTPGKVP
jgi:hypothetical protein